MDMPGRFFTLEVQPRLPEELGRLDDLANDLLYSWNRDVRRIFSRLDDALWESCGHNPKVFLRRIAQEKLEQALLDRGYMEDYQRVVGGYDAYGEARMRPEFTELLDPREDLVAYFCAEFGFHESFPIYSGGLGILAGDHCKAASDLGIPFIAVGLLYKQGYFTQTIDAHGNQIAQYTDVHCDDLPIKPALAGGEPPGGEPLRLSLDFPDRTVQVRVWEAKAGHIRLYLLDTDVPENAEHDRGITHRLYGGDRETRIQQEIVLGIGGTRALHQLGLRPNAWHINEGHSAFQILERCRFAVQGGLDFASALELVAGATLFTTHTPVPAGHDVFSFDLVSAYFSHYAQELGIPFAELFALGQSGGAEHDFNMTTLAMRGSRFHNGVSRIHGGVAAQMEGHLWPQIPVEENPIDYVTNGVHVQTFLAREWVGLFDMRFHEWESELLDPDFWNRIDEIPDYHYWSIHRALKQQMLEYVSRRVEEQHRRNGSSLALIKRITREIDDPTRELLVFGFARRFATYKRATLLFSDPHRLSAILNNPERPGVIIFAGKAHPNDEPGQQLIRVIHELSLSPEFIGRIILLEGYDLALARQLVSGVDVWLNTPEYPLEASGTSGQKAAINGAINLSVLDGWWGEGFNQENGWAIAPRPAGEGHNEQDAEDLLDTLEYDVMPLYYAHSGQGYSQRWVQLSKASMKSTIPRFNAQRMVMDYLRKFYSPAKRQGRRLSAGNGDNARKLAAWKARVGQCWPGVTLTLAQEPLTQTLHGEPIPLRVRVGLNGLSRDDVVVECLLGSQEDERLRTQRKFRLDALNGGDSDSAEFALELLPEISGLLHYKLRIYPFNPLLSHPFETGLMRWL